MELTKLQKHFPGSLRVRGLEGMVLEARACVLSQSSLQSQAMQSSLEALRCYDEMLREDPCNAVARKRKVVILSATSVSRARNY